MTGTETNQYVLSVKNHWMAWPPVWILMALFPILAGGLVWFGNSTLESHSWQMALFFWGIFLAFEIFWVRAGLKTLMFMREDSEHSVWVTPAGLRIRHSGHERFVGFDDIAKVELSGSKKGITSQFVLLALHQPVNVPPLWGDIVRFWSGKQISLETPEAPRLLDDIEERRAA